MVETQTVTIVERADQRQASDVGSISETERLAHEAFYSSIGIIGCGGSEFLLDGDPWLTAAAPEESEVQALVELYSLTESIEHTAPASTMSRVGYKKSNPAEDYLLSSTQKARTQNNNVVTDPARLESGDPVYHPWLIDHSSITAAFEDTYASVDTAFIMARESVLANTGEDPAPPDQLDKYVEAAREEANKPTKRFVNGVFEPGKKVLGAVVFSETGENRELTAGLLLSSHLLRAVRLALNNGREGTRLPKSHSDIGFKSLVNLIASRIVVDGLRQSLLTSSAEKSAA